MLALPLTLTGRWSTRAEGTQRKPWQLQPAHWSEWSPAYNAEAEQLLCNGIPPSPCQPALPLLPHMPDGSEWVHPLLKHQEARYENASSPQAGMAVDGSLALRHRKWHHLDNVQELGQIGCVEVLPATDNDEVVCPVSWYKITCVTPLHHNTCAEPYMRHLVLIAVCSLAYKIHMRACCAEILKFAHHSKL